MLTRISSPGSVPRVWRACVCCPGRKANPPWLPSKSPAPAKLPPSAPSFSGRRWPGRDAQRSPWSPPSPALKAEERCRCYVSPPFPKPSLLGHLHASVSPLLRQRPRHVSSFALPRKDQIPSQSYSSSPLLPEATALYPLLQSGAFTVTREFSKPKRDIKAFSTSAKLGVKDILPGEILLRKG